MLTRLVLWVRSTRGLGEGFALSARWRECGSYTVGIREQLLRDLGLRDFMGT